MTNNNARQYLFVYIPDCCWTLDTNSMRQFCHSCEISNIMRTFAQRENSCENSQIIRKIAVSHNPQGLWNRRIHRRRADSLLWPSVIIAACISLALITQSSSVHMIFWYALIQWLELRLTFDKGGCWSKLSNFQRLGFAGKSFFWVFTSAKLKAQLRVHDTRVASRR